jgi:hypothetical protein
LGGFHGTALRNGEKFIEYAVPQTGYVGNMRDRSRRDLASRKRVASRRLRDLGRRQGLRSMVAQKTGKP